MFCTVPWEESLVFLCDNVGAFAVPWEESCVCLCDDVGVVFSAVGRELRVFV